MPQTEREAQQRWGSVRRALPAEDHPPCAIARREVALHTAGKAGPVASLRFARPELMRRDPFTLQPCPLVLTDGAARATCMSQVLGERLAIESDREAAAVG